MISEPNSLSLLKKMEHEWVNIKLVHFAKDNDNARDTIMAYSDESDALQGLYNPNGDHYILRWLTKPSLFFIFPRSTINLIIIDGMDNW